MWAGDSRTAGRDTHAAHNGGCKRLTGSVLAEVPRDPPRHAPCACVRPTRGAEIRLRRGGRTRGDKGATRAADVAPVVPLDSSGSDSSGPTMVGSVLGLNTPARRAARTAIDEWGLYDPEVCGYGALLASLGTAENREAEPLDGIRRSCCCASRRTRSAFRPRCWSRSQSQNAPSNGLHQRRRLSRPVGVARFAPLALWAHANEGESPAPVLAGFSPASRAVARWISSRIPQQEERAGDDLAALVGRLTLPAFTAGTSMPPAAGFVRFESRPHLRHLMSYRCRTPRGQSRNA